MKKLYYFSKAKLKYIEIKNYKSKFAYTFVGGIFSFSAFIFLSYYLITSFFFPDNTIDSLKKENALLYQKLKEVVVKYESLNLTVDSLIKTNDDLRLAANLKPISPEERTLGIGGGQFNNVLDFIKNENKVPISELLSYVDEISRKVEFEKQNYIEIQKGFERNEKLFAAIPALKPVVGRTTASGFGVRLHPIFRKFKMHDGVDIIADVGTTVIAPGNGKVDFVGYRTGLGLTIEIDHGFGYRTIYAHLSKTLVKEGQKVERWQKIGATGNSGLSSGPHLHYEIHHNGIKLDPENFFFEDLTLFENIK